MSKVNVTVALDPREATCAVIPQAIGDQLTRKIYAALLVFTLTSATVARRGWCAVPNGSADQAAPLDLARRASGFAALVRIVDVNGRLGPAVRFNSIKETLMWTLVIITLLTAQTGSGGANGRGGVSTTTTFLDFRDQETCNAAANALAVKTETFPGTATTWAGFIGSSPSVWPDNETQNPMRAGG
jgi:hypothetical protein